MRRSRSGLKIRFTRIQSTGNAEITEFDLSIVIHQEIFWFDVSMDDSLRFQIVQTVEHLQIERRVDLRFHRHQSEELAS